MALLEREKARTIRENSEDILNIRKADNSEQGTIKFNCILLKLLQIF